MKHEKSGESPQCFSSIRSFGGIFFPCLLYSSMPRPCQISADSTLTHNFEGTAVTNTKFLEACIEHQWHSQFRHGNEHLSLWKLYQPVLVFLICRFVCRYRAYPEIRLWHGLVFRVVPASVRDLLTKD